MTTITGHNPFAPPPTPGFVRAVGLALLAHGVLVMVLTIGVQWRRDLTPVTVEAELWSAVPVQAAPPQLTPPEPEPELVPRPTPPVRTPDADIAIAKEKVRLQKEKQLEREKLEQEKLKQEKLKQEKLKQEKDKEKDKLARALEAKKLEETRRKNIDRMAALAGSASGSGDARSTGTAAQSSGPSPGYAGRIKALLRRNTTYVDTIVGNPTTEVEVRTTSDGTIISRKLVKSSGVKSWDDAVLNAIDKTEVFPRDVDGRVPSPMIIVHSPN